MRAVLCRVNHASVIVDGQAVGSIGRGLLVYVGVVAGDGPGQVEWMARKIPALRVFPDERGRMNRSAADVEAGLLLIPNFTLAARMTKGTRPSFTDAADPPVARPLFDDLTRRCAEHVATAAGLFGAEMTIDAQFAGPVTLILETPGT